MVPCCVGSKKRCRCVFVVICFFCCCASFFEQYVQLFHLFFVDAIFVILHCVFCLRARLVSLPVVFFKYSVVRFCCLARTFGSFVVVLCLVVVFCLVEGGIFILPAVGLPSCAFVDFDHFVVAIFVDLHV